MSEGSSFEFDEVDHLTAGTVGPPGQRIFYLQAAARGQVVTLKLEKNQVAALAAYLTALLADLPPVPPVTIDMDLIEPVLEEWVVGSLGVSYDEEVDRFVVIAQQLIVRDEDDPEADDDLSMDGGIARFTATREQATALAARGAQLVASGRPSCSLCGNPMDPEGHVCPRLNGHKRPG